jgi:hypothetical protein
MGGDPTAELLTLQSFAVFVQGRAGRREPRNDGTTERRNDRTTERQNDGTTERRNDRTTERQNDGTTDKPKRGQTRAPRGRTLTFGAATIARRFVASNKKNP